MLLATPDETHASLQLVVREISTELNEARTALEAFAENTGDRGALHRFAAHVHLARGALRLAEVYGGALLGEEMEQVARHVLQPEAVRHMVQNAAFYPRQAVALGTVSGRGVPTTR